MPIVHCIILQWRDEVTRTQTHSRKRRTAGVLCTGLRGKWPSNSLDVPWPAGEGGPSRDAGRRGTNIHTPIIREKVARARRRRGEREGDSLENRCATIDRPGFGCPLNYHIRSPRRRSSRFNRADYRVLRVRSIKMGYRIIIRLGVACDLAA